MFLSTLQIQRHGRVLAPQAREAADVFGVGAADILHLLQLQRGTLRPAQHDLCQHRQGHAVPLPHLLTSQPGQRLLHLTGDMEKNIESALKEH